MENNTKKAGGQNEIAVSWNKSLRLRLTVVVVLVSLFGESQYWSAWVKITNNGMV